MNRHKKNIRPSDRKVDMQCEVCQSKGTAYFTNDERLKNTTIQQYCKNCGSVTIYRIKDDN